MKTLLIGSGGREHAMAWKLKQSPLLSELHIAPGNPGMASLGTCHNVKADDIAGLLALVEDEGIEFVIVGPEAPLVAGLSDWLEPMGIPCFGPSGVAAQLEGSKAYSKRIMEKYNIPTAAYGEFTDAASARAYVEKHGAPIVVKADGLAAGKGVTVAMTKQEALNAIDECFNGKFGEAGEKLVIEEYLDGEELSFFALLDGETALELGSAQDHKRVGEGDTGPNTGGMGTYSPAPVATPAFHAEVMENIVRPMAKAMVAEGAPYRGVLFVGLMATKQGAKVIEFNVRFGDPETQSLLPRIDGDLLPYLHATATGRLAGMKPVQLKPESALCVVYAANGYPDEPLKGTVIGNLDEPPLPGTVIFHAGTTKNKAGEWAANGGRVLGVTGLGATLEQAQANAYAAVSRIHWPEGFYRRDIGWRALKRDAA
ncbi:phosphoribosylamine--glycine ligase [bacterium]|nr:phosphoribosylamine--glycine ligase [bacterium]